jgi:hypothetical protein
MVGLDRNNHPKRSVLTTEKVQASWKERFSLKIKEARKYSAQRRERPEERTTQINDYLVRKQTDVCNKACS